MEEIVDNEITKAVLDPNWHLDFQELRDLEERWVKKVNNLI